MGRLGGPQNEVGIGIESYAAPGVAVAEAAFIKWMDLSIQGISEKGFLKSARGLREENIDSFIRRKFSRGTIKFVPNATNMPFFLSLALGSVATATNADASGNVYDHTFTVNQTNATPRTATVTIKQGGTQTQQFLNCVVDKLSLSIQDGYPECTVEIIGQYPGSDTMSPSYSQETHPTYATTTAKFGTSLTAALAASATPLKSFQLEIANNFLLDDAFLFGSNGITAGNLTAGRLSVSGSYSLPFSSTTELDKYLANTKNAIALSMTGASIGTAETEEILIKIGRAILTKEPVTYPLDGIDMLEQEFQAEYEATDKMIQAVVTNLVANGSGATYNPA